MSFFSDFIGDTRILYYQQKALSLDISPRFFLRHPPEKCLQIDKIILASKTKSGFRRKARMALYYHGITDFYDFSLALGGMFGVYNVYSFCYLSENIKKQLVEIDCDVSWTKDFMGKYFDDFLFYFQKKYNITPDDCISKINNMFSVRSDESLYADSICHDIGKILITSQLLLYSLDFDPDCYDIASMISTGQMISTFEKFNQKKNMINHVLK